jgi:hypothetical protein
MWHKAKCERLVYGALQCSVDAQLQQLMAFMKRQPASQCDNQVRLLVVAYLLCRSMALPGWQVSCPSHCFAIWSSQPQQPLMGLIDVIWHCCCCCCWGGGGIDDHLMHHSGHTLNP